MAAMAALTADHTIRLVVVVDDDIDVYNEQEVLWAIATRVNAQKDISMIPWTTSSDLDPSSYDETGLERGHMTTKIIIDANWGLGEGVVSGAENVDRFVVDKDAFTILDAYIGKKAKQLITKTREVYWDDVPLEKQSMPCISNDEIVAIAKLALLLEERLGEPQDIEWAIDPAYTPPNNVFLLQTRPVKVAAKKPESVTDRMIDLIAKRFYSP